MDTFAVYGSTKCDLSDSVGVHPIRRSQEKLSPPLGVTPQGNVPDSYTEHVPVSNNA
jgi:hypothetical protein